MKTIEKLKTVLRNVYFIPLILCLIFASEIGEWFDRQAKTNAIQQNTNRLQNNRSMLDARARIQVILITAALEGRKLAPSEVDQITKLWKAAEYEQASN